MKRVLVGIVALAALAVGATPALADKQTERQAVRLLSKAGRQASHDAACKIRDQPPSLTHDAPSQDLLNTLGIFRRPATAEDTLPAQMLTFFHFAQGIYVDYVRVAHAADGTSYFVIPVRNVGLAPQTDACLQVIHTDLLQLVKGKPDRVRHRALQLFRREVRTNHRIAKRAPREGVFLFDHPSDGSIGSGGGGAGAKIIQATGMFG